MPARDRFLVVCAVAQELRALDLPRHVATLLCGVGPVEAGISLATALAQASYDLVLNVGVAGGFTPETDVGTAVVVTRESYADLGREDGEALQLPENTRLETQVPGEMHARLTAVRAVFGPGITSASVTTSDARARDLRRRFPGIVSESMEGFALARASAHAATPFVQIRGISNRVGDRATAGWNLETGLRAAAELTRAVMHALA